MSNSIKNQFTSAQIPRSAYQEYSTDIAHYNLKALSMMSHVGMMGGILLVVACLPPINLLDMINGYAAITALFALVFVLCITVLRKHESAVLPVYYVFILSMLTIGILMGTIWGKDTNATTFVMLVLLLPMLIIDKPTRINITFGIMTLIFCIVDYYVKSSHLFELDLTNAIIFYVLSILISGQTIRAKMSDIIIKRELKRQRDIDTLTNLGNRGAFERVVSQYIHESNKNAVLLIMDVDNFKSVNDTLGHATGDRALQLVGQYLRSAFRSGDTISRLGGDEFVAFLPAAGDIQKIKSKAELLIKQVSEIELDKNASCRIGVSIGLAQYPTDGCSFEELYKRADAALYQAKESGKGKCYVYDADSQDNSKTGKSN